MAEAIFTKLFGVKAKSAGIDPAGGDHKIDENVVIALKEIGVDIHGSKTKQLTESILEEADRIITFRCSDKIPGKYKSKTEDWELGVKREIGQKQSERTLDEIREIRDLIYDKVKDLVRCLEDEE